ARWRNEVADRSVDDAVQEVFVAFLKPGGALECTDDSRPGGFRAFLYGVARNIARRFETKRAGTTIPVDFSAVAGDDPALSQVLDGAWALSIMRAAPENQAENAARHGPEATRRVELLRLRFQMGMPIRDIAVRWAEPAENIHREYAKARIEFREALK